MTDLRPPAHIREDLRRGRCGGRYTLITCKECGREFREPRGYIVGLLNRGRSLPQYCSRMCYVAARRRRR